MSITRPVINFGKSVTMSVTEGLYQVTDVDFNFSELITVTDAVTDTD